MLNQLKIIKAYHLIDQLDKNIRDISLMKYPLYFYYLTVIIEDVILNIKDFDSGGFATPLTEIKEPSLILDKSSPYW